MYANLQPRATTVSPDLEVSASFDREGRPMFYFERGVCWRRRLASEVVRRVREGGERRRRLATERRTLGLRVSRYDVRELIY